MIRSFSNIVERPDSSLQPTCTASTESYPSAKDIKVGQINRLKELGFASKIDRSGGLLESNIPTPEIHRSRRFNKLVLVIPSNIISIRDQLDILNVKCELSLKNFNNVISQSPKSFYWILCQDGKRNLGKSPATCFASLSPIEYGLTLVEGIALVAQWPECVQDHSIDLIGSRYRSECTPTIYQWNGITRLSAINSDVSDGMCGSATKIHRQQKLNLFGRKSRANSRSVSPKTSPTPESGKKQKHLYVF